MRTLAATSVPGHEAAGSGVSACGRGAALRGRQRRGSATCHGSPGAGFFTPNLFSSTCTLCEGWAPTESQ